jgi:hypothetical protein
MGTVVCLDARPQLNRAHQHGPRNVRRAAGGCPPRPHSPTERNDSHGVQDGTEVLHGSEWPPMEKGGGHVRREPASRLRGVQRLGDGVEPDAQRRSIPGWR